MFAGFVMFVCVYIDLAAQTFTCKILQFPVSLSSYISLKHMSFVVLEDKLSERY